MSAFHSHAPILPLGAMTDSAHPFARNVAGEWRFDEGAGERVLDSGFYGNHGTLVGGASRVAGPGVEFDGITGHASVPHSPILQPSQITVIIRVQNVTTPAPFDALLMKSSNTSWHDGYGIHYDPSTVMNFWVGDFAIGGIAQISVNPLAVTTLVGTYDGSVVRVFANGVEGASMNYSGGISLTAGPLEFGRGRGNEYNVHAVVYFVTILNAALPREEARRLSS